VAEPARQIAFPEWTEYQKKNGLDPLGMQTSSVGFYQKLVPGIGNVTLRMRYYGLYAWLCHHYAANVRDTNPKSWQRFVRRAEALFALICHRHGGETGVAGIAWAGRTIEGLSDPAAPIDFAIAAEPGSDIYYLRQAWGAYGAAYASQVYEVGIFGIGKEHELPVPTPDIGEPLALAFAESLGPVADQFLQIHDRGTVTLEELDAMTAMAPSRIPNSSEERVWYERILFAEAGLERPTDLERRRTLLILLALCGQTGNAPNIQEIRWMLYTNNDERGNALSLATDELKDHRLKWWIYQANDLTHIAYETILKYTLDLLEPHAAGITLSQLISEVIGNLRTEADTWPDNWEYLLALEPAGDVGAEITLTEAAMADARWDKVCSAEGAWNAIHLLALVHARSRELNERIDLELKFLNPAVFQSLRSEYRFLESHAGQHFDAFLTKLIEQRIIRRHLEVALRKLRYQGDYTFLIESDEGKVRMRGKDGPAYTNPRLGSAMTFLKDIDLISESGLTEQGRKVLARV
jgi:hypothetical protein